jgi:hypothetical protein
MNRIKKAEPLLTMPLKCLLLDEQLLHWEYIYNCVRPHYSLGNKTGNKTPLQFLKAHGIIDDTNPLYQSHML